MHAKALELWIINNPRELYHQDPVKLRTYNDEPVYWCNNCLSLSIGDVIIDGENTPYCRHCNTINVHKGHIDTWLRLKSVKDKRNKEMYED